MKYLVDTDWIILHFRGNREVARRIEGLTPEGIGISVVSMGELYEGVYKASDPTRSEEALQLVLSEIDVVHIDDEVCRIYGQQRGRLRARNADTGNNDIWIGATAIRHGLTLLTNNRRHFEGMEGLSIISM